MASRRFTGREDSPLEKDTIIGPMPVDLVTALPPGYSPMPPGFSTDQERIMGEMRNSQLEVPDVK